MNHRWIIISLVLVLCGLGFFAVSSTASALLTLNATTVSSDAALTLTGAAASTWDIGANTLSLQATNNGAITTGTGLLTAGGSLYVTSLLGAGTSSPGATLHAGGTYHPLLASATSSRVVMGNTTSFPVIASLTVIATSTDASAKGLVVRGGGSVSANIFEVQDSANAVVFSILQGAGSTATTTVADSLIVDTSTLLVNSELNRVGILTLTPATQLEVMGTASTSALTVGGTGLTATTTNVYGGAIFDVDSNTLVVNGNENRVGIGTASPTTTLNVVGNSRIVGSITVTGDIILDKGTGSVSANAVTINSTSGVITDATDITASSTRAAITLTNSYVAAGSVMLVSLCSTPDANVKLGVAAAPGAGSATLTVFNFSGFDQTADYKICFLVAN